MNETKLQSYSIEHIFKIKDDYKILPDDLSRLYNDCYENKIKKSENYIYIKKLLKSMIKIKSNTDYSEDEIEKMKIISLLNKATSNNLNNVLQQLYEINFDKTLLYYLVDNIFLKILNDNKYLDLYFNIIENILSNNNFYYNDSINFFYCIIQKCQDFYKLLNDKKFYDEFKNSINNNVDFYFKKKKNFINCLKLIGLLFKNNYINIYLIKNIINDLYSNCDIKIELLYELLNIINDKLDDKYQKEIKNKIYGYYNNDNSRIMFLLDKLYSKKKNLILEKKSTPIKLNTINKIDNNMKLKNMINEYKIHKNLDESFDYINDFINDYDYFIEDYLYIIFECDDTNANTLLINLFINIITKFNNFKINVLNDMVENFDDILLDIPNANIYFNNLLEKLFQKKIINEIDLKTFKTKINLND